VIFERCDWRPPEAWKGRIDDPSDPLAARWHQRLSLWDGSPPRPAVAGRRRLWFVGCASDVGVGRNLGRRGAASAPAQIRAAMANLPAHFGDGVELVDAGDLLPRGDDLEGCEDALALLVSSIVAAGDFPIVLGGGHEIAFGVYEGIRSGLAEAGRPSPPSIVSFDAHFDLRPEGPQETPLSSGNMFRRIARLCAERGEEFRYRVVGIQRSSNTASLFALADRLGVEYHLAREFEESDPERLRAILKRWISEDRPLYVSLCFDVIAAAHAPAVSAPQPFGMDPRYILEGLRTLARSGAAAGLDIAEISPRFDRDDRTARLAAVLIFAWVNALAGLE